MLITSHLDNDSPPAPIGIGNLKLHPLTPKRSRGGRGTVGSPTRCCIGRESNAKCSLDIKEPIPPWARLKILYG